VVTRRQKLLAAGLVLTAGIALSWPLRRAEPLPTSRLGVRPPSADTAKSPPETVALEAKSNLGALNRATLPQREDDRDPFAGMPAVVATVASEAPVFSTVSSGPSALAPPDTPAPARQIHVVHEGDSLDRLAKRYLGDEGRALEIFDLNRDVLENPHVLRIGVELRIPSTESIAP
jgi:nucleoid-associated protein YgaU